jgi:flagellum-specific ATP synthase
MMRSLNTDELCARIARRDLLQVSGRLESASGLLLSCALPAAVGDHCAIQASADRVVLAEVIGFRDDTSFLVPFEANLEASPGLRVTRLGHGLLAPVGPGLLGRVLDGLGRPIDGKGPLRGCTAVPVYRTSPAPLQRARIAKPFATGQRAIDGLLTFGKGQRVGVFAGSGVGKSTLLGEIAKGAEADVNVVVLVGERGREVRAFLEDSLGPKGMARSVVVVATCDEAPLMRARAAHLAVTMAEYHRNRGADVLFMLDSLTRLAMAQRELGLALGEPPSARGYTPSVFQLLADTVERLGTDARGSITGILTVLVDGDDLDEPIADATRGMLDGHIVLARRLAERGHYPAIDVARSISRVAREVTDAGHRDAVRKARAALAVYAEAEDLIRIGAYAKGSSPQIDRAVELLPAISLFLRQDIDERSTPAATREALGRIAAHWPF